jgi:pimeloyl-ACP methyl ester carboxylesterase
MPFDPTYSFVENEGCTLHYWHQGSGPLLFFIPGGSGHGSQYNNIMNILSTTYTCCTFDRRGMSSSTVEGLKKPLSPPQQARDIAAIIKALGFEKSLIFGNSLGGILGFQLAIDYPEIIDHLICHEAPTSMILPDASERFERILLLLKTYRESGLMAASQLYLPIFQGYDDPGLGKPVQAPMENLINFLENEFLIGSIYNPDWRKIVRNKVSIGILLGKRSGDAFYARAASEQAEILGCTRMVVPGHHAGFEVEAEEFAPALKEMIGKLEEGRKRKTN